MILKKNIRYSFFAILILFALNFSINFWSTQKKQAAIELLQQAISSQALTTSVKQDCADIQRQVSRLGQVRIEAASAPLAPGDIAQMDSRSAAIAEQIATLVQLSDNEARAKAIDLQKRYADLAASWHVFYQNFGVNQAQALTELALHIEPSSQHLLHETIPLLEALEKQHIASARQELIAAQWWSDTTALMVFIVSLCIAVAIAVQIYRRIARGLDKLKLGVESIRNGDTAHRITLKTDDELGEIASSFNNITDALYASHVQTTRLDRELAQCSAETEKQRQVADSLLLNILPATVAEEFRRHGSVAPKYLEDATIIFTDFVGFSSFTENLAAEDLVKMLHEYFSAFDEITARYGLEKLKTIGDSYMCAGGLPERNPSHPVDAVMAAMEMVRVVTERRGMDNQHNWSIRIGIHTGHLIAGIVGKQKFAYDIWGESVNYASRLESNSEPNRIALSGQTYSRIKDFFECEKHSKTLAKDSQTMDMYLVNGFLPSLTDDFKQIPPAAFLRRYRSYFQKDPPSFPPQRANYSANSSTT
jgi:class 3 adenylate cyclase/HAMP domain-containing protein